jgi:hypothetical protein
MIWSPSRQASFARVRPNQKTRHDMNPGFIGGIAGSLMGVAGGLIGTYFGIKNTNSARERSFVIRSAVACWVGASLFIASTLLWPKERTWIFVAYGIVLPLAIRYWNKKQTAIRREEKTNA